MNHDLHTYAVFYVVHLLVIYSVKVWNMICTCFEDFSSHSELPHLPFAQLQQSGDGQLTGATMSRRRKTLCIQSQRNNVRYFSEYSKKKSSIKYWLDNEKQNWKILGCSDAHWKMFLSKQQWKIIKTTIFYFKITHTFIKFTIRPGRCSGANSVHLDFKLIT